MIKVASWHFVASEPVGAIVKISLPSLEPDALLDLLCLQISPNIMLPDSLWRWSILWWWLPEISCHPKLRCPRWLPASFFKLRGALEPKHVHVYLLAFALGAEKFHEVDAFHVELFFFIKIKNRHLKIIIHNLALLLLQKPWIAKRYLVYGLCDQLFHFGLNENLCINLLQIYKFKFDFF